MKSGPRETGRSDHNLRESRGVPTNRGIRTDEHSMPGGSVMELLGLSTDELIGKKILDVGTGGGRAVEESRDIGLDVTGIEFVAGVSLKDEDQFDDSELIRRARRELKGVAEKYPSSIIGADAAGGLPFKDNSFDVVYSNLALPGSARNPTELAISLLEMIRVAKERVVITDDTDNDEDMEGVTLIGIGDNQFRMAYRGFLDFLVKSYGVKLRIIPKTGEMYRSALDFDVTKKRAEKLNAERAEIIDEAERLRR